MPTYEHKDNPSIQAEIDDAELSSRLYRADAASEVTGQIRFQLRVTTKPIVGGQGITENIDVPAEDAFSAAEFTQWKQLTKKLKDHAIAQKFRAV